MLKHLTSNFSTVQTPQSEPIPGTNQVKNSAGGYSFEVTKWTKLDRFLILGTEGGSYYVSESKMTKDSCKAVQECIAEDGIRTVKRIVEISDAGRAPKNDYALFALAMATKFGNDETRKYAYSELPKVARIGTHLFHFAEFKKNFGGWSRGSRRAVANWYLTKEFDSLAYQIVKYRQRDGWDHKDLIRLSHPKSKDPNMNQLFKWILGKDLLSKSQGGTSLPNIINGFEKIQATTDEKVAAKLIVDYNLPREAVPTELLKSKIVWEALLQKMPLTAMIRNLANMTRIGLLEPMSDTTKLVVKNLKDQDLIHKARVHPIAILGAMGVYGKGRSDRDNSKSWNVLTPIIDALDEAFYLSFKNVKPSNNNLMLSLDVSGSMAIELSGLPGVSARAASSAMAMVTARAESNYVINGFSSTFVDLDISPRRRLDDIVKYTERLPFSRTDCAIPMLHATKNNLDIDAFVIYTDSETWFGNIHPVQALERYKQKKGKDAKLIVVGMVGNPFTIADPNNPRMLDVVGFDTTTPSVISDFASN